LVSYYCYPEPKKDAALSIMPGEFCFQSQEHQESDELERNTVNGVDGPRVFSNFAGRTYGESVKSTLIGVALIPFDATEDKGDFGVSIAIDGIMTLMNNGHNTIPPQTLFGVRPPRVSMIQGQCAPSFIVEHTNIENGRYLAQVYPIEPMLALRVLNWKVVHPGQDTDDQGKLDHKTRAFIDDKVNDLFVLIRDSVTQLTNMAVRQGMQDGRYVLLDDAKVMPPVNGEAASNGFCTDVEARVSKLSDIDLKTYIPPCNGTIRAHEAFAKTISVLLKSIVLRTTAITMDCVSFYEKSAVGKTMTSALPGKRFDALLGIG